MQAYSVPSNIVQDLTNPKTTETLSTKGLQAIVGIMANLVTNDKSSIVAAINELASAQFRTTFDLCFTAPQTLFKMQNDSVMTVTEILLDGADGISYSSDKGSTFTAIALPLAAPLALPSGWLLFKIAFSTASALAAAHLVVME